MEENEKKRQEDIFNKKISRWGWVVTLIFAGIPYFLLIVGIEVFKTQFSDVSWRSAYGIAGAVIATAIAGVLRRSETALKGVCKQKVKTQMKKISQ